MRGNINIINSEKDKQKAGLTRENIIKQATINVRYDDAIYPSGYDHMQMKDGDENYVPPIFRTETEIDQGVLDRFGIVL
jgi:hypothetical protein